MKWKIKSTMPRGYNALWRSMFAEVVEFGQRMDGRWQVMGDGGFFLTRRAARAAALTLAGVQPKTEIPEAFRRP